MAKQKKFPGTKKRALAKRALEENDPEWQRWYLDIARRRLGLQHKRRFIVSTYEVDGEVRTVERRQSVPTECKKYLTGIVKEILARRIDEHQAVRDAWSEAAGPDVAAETSVFSFKGGILTVSVYSSTMLQELRLFQKEPILIKLRNIWPVSVPLVQLKFKPGKR